jgi:hypothetical protein
MATEHAWTLRFDREVCRDCGVGLVDAGQACRPAPKVRPIAAFRKPEGEPHATQDRR